MLTLTALPDEFSYITLTLSRRLTLAQAQQAAGALGYALRKMNGESLGEAESVTHPGGNTVLTFFFDSTKCRRSTYSFEEAFEEAARYIVEGSPVRRTNRTGPVGTRLVEGIGPVDVQITVDGQDVAPEPAPEPENAYSRWFGGAL